MKKRETIIQGEMACLKNAISEEGVTFLYFFGVVNFGTLLGVVIFHKKFNDGGNKRK